MSAARKSLRTKHKSWWSSLDKDGRRRVVRRACAGLITVSLISGFLIGLYRLESSVEASLHARVEPTLRIVDVPEALAGDADLALRDALTPLMAKSWTGDGLCRAMAQRAANVGWVRQVQSVRRAGDGTIEVRCTYRLPAAMVQAGVMFYLIDEESVRLPGEYAHDARFMFLAGVKQPVPPVGRTWEGDDVAAGLNVVSALRDEPYAPQITAVILDNFGGRVDERAHHIELATDQQGRILWGSAPGREVEENTVAQKLAILRENHRRTTRADARHAIIGICTYPDRYTVPG